MNILLFSSAYNGMCQRIHRELLAEGCRVAIELSAEEEDMLDAVEQFRPDLIVCPYLKHRVPEQIWRYTPCLIVHPGVEGDRGPSSLDWAITDDWQHWGVTLLQADAEMDAGAIWGTREFVRRNTAKASLYRREVIAAASALVREALLQFRDPTFLPRPLDYSLPGVQGRLRPLLRQKDREIHWHTDSTADIVRKINAADSFPGVLTQVDDNHVYLFGAVGEFEPVPGWDNGRIVGHKDSAVCFAARDGRVWVRQMKMAPRDGQKYFKLPALQVVKRQFGNADDYLSLPMLASELLGDIDYVVKNGVAYLSFNFYNGAMNTVQCRSLLAVYRELLLRPDVRVIALLGGEDFWSNGIHLNCIEAADNPARESWQNINAIDDLVRDILLTSSKMTVAALRCNAGAGGAIVPLACDRVLARQGVVLNPHYQTMGLYGSEYWTYLLPRRVGQDQALRLTEQCLPVAADEALTMGMADQVLPESWEEYHQHLQVYCEKLASDRSFDAMLAAKAASRQADEQQRPLDAYRAEELRRMKAVFDDPDSDYHRLRYQFVHKIVCGKTPERLRAPQMEKRQLAIA